MALELNRNYQTRWMDFDRHGRIQPYALLDLFQDMATLHAEIMGIGRDDMVPKGVFWAVVRSKFEILHDPKHFQTLHVRTWPHSASRFSFIRDFEVRDDADELLVKASTEWVLMDLETRKFASVLDYYNGPTDFSEDRAFEGKMRKIKKFDEGNMPVYTVVPGYSDIDVNEHVNNAVYANYVVDALKPTREGGIRTFQIDYRHEVLPDSPLQIHTLVEDGHVLSQGVREDGNIAFASAIELR